MKILFLLLSFMYSTHVFAYLSGPYFDPQLAVGYNVIQGSHFRVGADLGYALTSQLAVGLGGYYVAGEHPAHDREMGMGPFAAFIQPLTSYLAGYVREDVDYVDLFYPMQVTSTDGTKTYTHNRQTGVNSVTTLGASLALTRNFGIAAGYRFVLALSNRDLDDDRSGYYFGLALGI